MLCSSAQLNVVYRSPKTRHEQTVVLKRPHFPTHRISIIFLICLNAVHVQVGVKKLVQVLLLELTTPQPVNPVLG